MFSSEEKRALLQQAFDSLASYLYKGTFALAPSPFPSWVEPRGVFVSLHNQNRLRGCVGVVSSPNKPVWNLVHEMAMAAASRDSRFPRLTRQELSSLEIEISILDPLEELRTLEDIQIGRHGLFVTGRLHSGVLLPQVALEYNWDRETFLSQVCLKAGLDPEAWKNLSREDIPGENQKSVPDGRTDLTLFRFGAQVFSTREWPIVRKVFEGADQSISLTLS